MIRKEKFVPGEYYHIYTRTILKSPEFKNYGNANRLAQAFLLGNSTMSSQAFNYLRNNRNPIFEKAVEIARQGKRLTDIISYSIMPDHYHLLLREKSEGGITDFIRRCNTSIAKYINTKFNRTGPLFEGNFKSKHVGSNEYLLHLSVYIHLNPLDFLSNKDWRFNKIKNWQSEKEKLLNYPLTSLMAFLKKDHLNQIISGEKIITGQFKNCEEYEEYLRDWAVNTSELEKINDFVID